MHFVKGATSAGREETWVQRLQQFLQQFCAPYLQLVSLKRRKTKEVKSLVETPTPDPPVGGAACGSSPHGPAREQPKQKTQNLDKGDDLMEDAGTGTGGDLGNSAVEVSNLVAALAMTPSTTALTKANSRLLKKHPVAPKWLRQLIRVVDQLHDEGTTEVPAGSVALDIWEVLVQGDKAGKKHLRDEGKNRRV